MIFLLIIIAAIQLCDLLFENRAGPLITNKSFDCIETCNLPESLEYFTWFHLSSIFLLLFTEKNGQSMKAVTTTTAIHWKKMGHLWSVMLFLLYLFVFYSSNETNLESNQALPKNIKTNLSTQTIHSIDESLTVFFMFLLRNSIEIQYKTYEWFLSLDILSWS